MSPYNNVLHGHQCTPVGMILLSLIENASACFDRGVLIAKTGPHSGSYSSQYPPEPRGRRMFDRHITKTGKTSFENDRKGKG